MDLTLVPNELICSICYTAIVDRLFLCCKFATCHICVDKMGYRCPQRCTLNNLFEREEVDEEMQHVTEEEVLVLYEVPARPSYMDSETMGNWIDTLLSRWENGKVNGFLPPSKAAKKFPPFSQIVVAIDFSPPIVYTENDGGVKEQDERKGANEQRRGAGVNRRLFCYCGNARRSVRAACTHTFCHDCAMVTVEKKQSVTGANPV